MTTIQFLKQTFKPYYKNFIVFFIITFLGIAAWISSPVFIREIINHLSQTKSFDQKLWLLVGGFLGVRLLDEWFWRIAEYKARKYVPEVGERARMLAYKAVLGKNHQFFVDSNTGKTSYYINNAGTSVRNLIDHIIWGLWPRSIAIILSVVFLLTTHWSIALIFAVWVTLLMYIVYRRGKEYSRRIAAFQENLSEASGVVADTIANHHAVKIFNRKDYELSYLAKQQKKVISNSEKAWRYNTVSNLIKGNSAAIISGIAIFLLCQLYFKGIVSLGDMVLFVAYVTEASTSIWELSWQIDQIYKLNGEFKTIVDNTFNAADEPTSDKKLKSLEGSDINISNLTFKYPDSTNKYVFRKLNLAIESGQRIGIVGKSGAGKSTLVGLLLKLNEPSSGVIQIAGQAYNEMSPDMVRQNIAYVPQDSSLFNRSIFDNIAYARKNAKREDVIKAAKLAECHDFILETPKGYDTLIGERGIKLSGGQRQRIAIARAFLSNKPILILDEATSSLDSVSEHAIQRALHRAMEKKTSIVIAHRLSTLKNLDRILVFSKGKIVEDGSHDELLEAKGVYSDLWVRQKDGFIA